MLNMIITYLFIGVLFNFLFDKLIDTYNLQENRLTLGQKITSGLLWPIAIIVFIYGFFQK